jgi:predicted nuclease of predicted toxin-antitoxin system
MARLYADEQFPLPVVKILRTLGHDVLTVQEANKAEQKIPDNEVLSYAISLNRAVLTLNRHDFIRLHKQNTQHQGIVICKSNSDWEQIAQRIHEIVITFESLSGQIVRVNRQK